jgi:hypothetical protein
MALLWPGAPLTSAMQNMQHGNRAVQPMAEMAPLSKGSQGVCSSAPGMPCGAEDSSGLQRQQKNVLHIQASRLACAALLGNGFAVTWGGAHPSKGSRAVQG